MAKQNPWMTEDVSGDGKVTALDALLVINRINARTSGDANGEGVIASSSILTSGTQMNSRAFDQAFEQTKAWLIDLDQKRRRPSRPPL